MTPQLTVTVGRLAIAVVGIPPIAAGTSAVIVATGATVLLIGGAIYLANANGTRKVSSLPVKKLK